MRAYRSCNYDPELFQKVKDGVSMRQVAEYYGLQVNGKGLCLCPFHHDTDPSLRIYPNGKGFYCFTCGTGGDQIKFAALYRDIKNVEAAQELAAAFGIPTQAPSSYREKREAELSRRKRAAVAGFARRAAMYLTAYRGLLCEAIRGQDSHFCEALQNLTQTEYLMEQLRECPEEVYKDRRVVRRIGEIERRIADWYVRIEPDGTISR